MDAFANWVVSNSQTYTTNAVAITLLIAIALATSAAFLIDRKVDFVARIVAAAVAGFTAWATYSEHWATLHTTAVLLGWFAVIAAIGFVALTAVKFARSFERPQSAKPVDKVSSKKTPVKPSGDTDAELAELVRSYKKDHPEAWAEIEAQVRSN